RKPQHVLLGQATDLPVGRQPAGELDQAVVQVRIAAFDRPGHRDPVALRRKEVSGEQRLGSTYWSRANGAQPAACAGRVCSKALTGSQSASIERSSGASSWSARLEVV